MGKRILTFCLAILIAVVAVLGYSAEVYAKEKITWEPNRKKLNFKKNEPRYIQIEGLPRNEDGSLASFIGLEVWSTDPEVADVIYGEINMDKGEYTFCVIPKKYGTCKIIFKSGDVEKSVKVSVNCWFF